MGQTLSEPIKDKHTSSSGDNRLGYGASGMQGWRIQMEDAHTTILNLLKEEGTDTAFDAADTRHVAFFAVYDGHGGSTVAKFSGKHLHRRILFDPEFKAKDYKQAIKNGFLGTDEDLKTNDEYLRDPSGCTAVTVMITEDWKLLCGNAGDSRAILSSHGKAIPLSHDHKPMNPEESARIRAAGGFVEFGRVNGSLALSRAVGDFEFKRNQQLPAEEQIVTVNPDIIERDVDLEEDEFVFIACDGIWDCMSNEEVVYYVRSQIAEGHTLPEIAEMIMDRCLAPDSDLGAFGCDNMTVIIVSILNGKTPEEWTEKVKSRFLEERAAGAVEPPPMNRPPPPPSSFSADDDDEVQVIDNSTAQ